MPRNPHPPRNGASSKKSPAVDLGDTSHIIFSNAPDKPKKDKAKDETPESSKTTASGGKSKDKATSDVLASDAPKKPDTRTLIGGASWTGKLPVNMLSEHCQKQKWDRPEYTMSSSADGFSSMVILKYKNPKSQEHMTLPSFKLPPTHKHLAVQETAVEARHFAAAYALFRISSMKNLHMAMPPKYKDLWKGDFAELKKADVKDGKELMYAADPFQAQKEREEIEVKKAKLRVQREKEHAAKEKAAEPGGLSLSGSKDLAKGWGTAPKVDMGKKIRRQVEALVRSHVSWNPNAVVLSADERRKIVAELSQLGFRRSHVDEATVLCKDKEETLEWLLVHVPEDDLPSWSLPEGYVAGISLASGDLKREAAIKRLTAGGYASELSEEMYDACAGNERKAAQRMQTILVQDIGSEMKNLNLSEVQGNGAETSSDIWTEEHAVLQSIYENRVERLDSDTFQVTLDGQPIDQPIKAVFRRPLGNYPHCPPILTINAILPAYIRLSVIRQALLAATESFLGDQMIFNIVDWLEHAISGIIENPGRLVDVSTVSGSGASSEMHVIRRKPKAADKRRPRQLNKVPGSPISLRLLSQWQDRQNNPKQQKMNRDRQSLPAWTLQEAIVSAVASNQIVIISGETGSGKSTQAVQFIMDDMIKNNLGEATNIICTQPRRISALGLADRVSDERCSAVGQEVGYAIRGESKQTVGVTKLQFVTTGVLLRRLQSSGGSTDDLVSALADISHIVVDEVHERSLDTDFLLALMKTVLSRRRDLKLILMSATLDASVFDRYFSAIGSVGRIEIQGRTHPVEDIYLDDVVRMTGFGRQRSNHDDDEEFEENGIGGAIQAVGIGINYSLIASLVRKIDSDLSSQDGGILIFLPGTMEISRTIDVLRAIPNIHALPLHASLMPAEQRRVFLPAPRGMRKVIASTNVAETSITISDIVAVIDSGRVKETHYDAATNMVKLEEVWASQAACKQRRGRAGRVQAGKCYKLYTQTAAAKMPERPEPEIRRTPLEQLCLAVKAMGVDHVPSFLAQTLTPPETMAVEGALSLLRRMGALDGHILTALGRHMSMIPADLRCAKLMVYGTLFGCLEPCLIIASILSVKSPFVYVAAKRDEIKVAREAFAENQGDLIADLRAFESWEEKRRKSSYRDVRSWCEQNFLSANTLNDIASNRSQYLSSLKDSGLLGMDYNRTTSPPATSSVFLRSLILSALHPQTLRILYPRQKYTATSSGTLPIDPSAKEIRYYDSSNNRLFIHPSSTMFSAQTFPGSATFMSYFQKTETSKVFVREVSPAGVFAVLLFGGPIELDTRGRGLLVDEWVMVRGWARIGVLVGRLRGLLDEVLAKWVEQPGVSMGKESGVVNVVKRLVELEGMDR